jgi:hypothetical protein
LKPDFYFQKRFPSFHFQENINGNKIVVKSARGRPESRDNPKKDTHEVFSPPFRINDSKAKTMPANRIARIFRKAMHNGRHELCRCTII